MYKIDVVEISSKSLDFGIEGSIKVDIPLNKISQTIEWFHWYWLFFPCLCISVSKEIFDKYWTQGNKSGVTSKYEGK